MTSLVPIELLETMGLKGGLVSAPQEGDAANYFGTLFKSSTIEKDGDGEGDAINNKFKAVISTTDVDRDGDVIEASGFDIKQFMKNPVVLFAHDTRSVIGSADAVTKDDRKVTAAFHINTDIALGREVATLLNARDMRATSVGFEPNAAHTIEEGKTTECERCLSVKGPSRGGFFRPAMHFLKQTLREFSIVAIPANAGALVRMKDAASRIPFESGGLSLMNVDEAAVQRSRLDSLERRVDALCIEADDVTTQPTGSTELEDNARMVRAATAALRIKRALRIT